MPIGRFGTPHRRWKVGFLIAHQATHVTGIQYRKLLVSDSSARTPHVWRIPSGWPNGRGRVSSPPLSPLCGLPLLCWLVLIARVLLINAEQSGSITSSFQTKWATFFALTYASPPCTPSRAAQSPQCFLPMHLTTCLPSRSSRSPPLRSC